MLITSRQFLNGASVMIRTFGKWVSYHELEDVARADHVCYKCAPDGSYDRLRRLMLDPSEGLFAYESFISGRRISVIRFRTPMRTTLGPVSVLELCDHKPGDPDRSRWDHIEVYPHADGTAHDVAREFMSRKLQPVRKARPHHVTWDLDFSDDFTLRIEQEPLLATIAKEMLAARG